MHPNEKFKILLIFFPLRSNCPCPMDLYIQSFESPKQLPRGSPQMVLRTVTYVTSLARLYPTFSHWLEADEHSIILLMCCLKVLVNTYEPRMKFKTAGDVLAWACSLLTTSNAPFWKFYHCRVTRTHTHIYRWSWQTTLTGNSDLKCRTFD